VDAVVSAHPALRATASRWCSSPSFLTAYSALRPGGTPDDRRALAEPVAERVLLAGEATSANHPGTMHGAWASGTAAADRLVAAGAATVAVVGAGLAGLAAARRLHDAGRSVVVLEATELLGGRAGVDRSIGVAVHPGAAWVHGEIGNPVADTAARLGVPLHRWVGERRVVVAGLGVVDPAIVERVEVWRAEVERRLDAAAAAGADRALWPVLAEVLAALPLAPIERRVLTSLVRSSYENVTAAAVDDLSLRYRSEPYHLPGDDLLVGADLRRIVDDVAAGLDIRLATTVTAIAAVPGSPHRTVTTTQGDLQVDGVVVTVPIGALLAGTPTFDPPLPAATRAALEMLTPGAVVKVTATFASAFWAPAPAVHVVDDAPGHVPAWVDVSAISGRPTLAGFATGPASYALESLDEAALRAHVDRCLAPAAAAAVV